MDTKKATTPVTQVSIRGPRQADIQNLPHRCMTMKKKNRSTLHRCKPLKKCPTAVVCHQLIPPTARADRDDYEYQRGEGEHPEHIDPRRHIGRLLVGKGPVGRQRRQ